MEQNNYINIQLAGNGFSPKKLKELTRLPIEIVIESGEIAKRGRYKGKPSPYGLGVLTIEFKENSIENWCEKLLEHKISLKISNLHEITFDVHIDCTRISSFTFTSELAGKLKELNADVSFTPYSKIKESDDELIESVKEFYSKKELSSEKYLEIKNELLKAILINKQYYSLNSRSLQVYLLKILKQNQHLNINNLKNYLENQEQ